jgi:predicted phage baseplate assembly protein
MPLETQGPQLSQLTYEEIKRLALLRIPRYTPEWTDFNENDPGITLVELFAWLTELMLEQMNLLPQWAYLKILSQLGLDLRPAQPARADLVFSPQAGAALVGPVQKNARFSGQGSNGDPVFFETTEGLSLIRLNLTDVQVFDGTAFTRVTSANQVGEASFYPLGPQALLGSALYLGFAQSDPQAVGRIFPEEMSWKIFLSAEDTIGQVLICTEKTDQTPVPPVRLEWEYRSSPNRWKRLEVFSDGSVGFTREGYIHVQGPAQAEMTIEGRVPEKRFWLRVRLANGGYPSGRVPRLDFIRANIVEAENLITVEEEVLGTSNGEPDQQFTLERSPVEVRSLILEVQDANGEQEPWTRKDDLLASSSDDPHFILVPTSGQIRFGNGENGRIPTAGSLIIARSYRYGGGKAGNLDAGQINSPQSPLDGIEEVSNLRKAVGGRDEEDINEFIRKAPSKLRHNQRAMSEEDFASLAEEAGGVGKAIALPGYHPDYPGVDVPGAVTVIVIPDSEEMPPQPSQPQMEVVCRYLNQRRLLTTELYIRGPKYVPIRVEAKVVCQPYAAVDQVRAEIIQALVASLDPLGKSKPPQGLRADNLLRLGGSFGVDFYPTSVFSLIQSVKDVVAVEYLAVNKQEGADLNLPIELQRDEIVYLSPDYEITVVPSSER